MIGENNFTSKQIGTYRLITELQSSRLNSTYKAEQLQPSSQSVVFKLFHAVHLPEIKRERFLQEIALLKKVKHTHILPLLDGGFYEDSPYIVSEYARHGSLRDRLSTQTTQFLSTQEATAIISDIGRALQFFHQINITHGNLKPENILFDENDRVLLADCNITTIVDSIPVEQAHNTNTFPYMAPEQFSSRMNKESDQYALGCIAYELLTGIAPFAGTHFHSIANEHINESLIPPTQLNMLLPEYMQKAILKAMAVQETNRYPHIKDFIAALTSSAKAQNASVIASSSLITQASPVSSTSLPVQETIIHQSQRDSEESNNSTNSTTIVRQDEKPPDTPATEIDSPVEPVLPSQLEPASIAQTPMPPDEMEPPPGTPPSTDDSGISDDSQPSPQRKANEAIREEVFFEDDVPTRPSLEALPSPVTSADIPTHEINRPDSAIYAAGVPAAIAQMAPPALYSTFGGYSRYSQQDQDDRLRLAKRFTLLVGISWAIIAVLILSMVFIIIPSAHTLTNIAGTIGQKPTQHPIVRPTPTTKPTVIPTLRPTPRPTQPRPTPSPTPMPTPSPTPVPEWTISSTSLDAHTDCSTMLFYFKCSVTLSLPQNFSGNLHWSASSTNIMAFFVPSRGTLSPGQQQPVTVFVRKSCPLKGDLIFQSDTTKIDVSWSC